MCDNSSSAFPQAACGDTVLRDIQEQVGGCQVSAALTNLQRRGNLVDGRSHVGENLGLVVRDQERLNFLQQQLRLAELRVRSRLTLLNYRELFACFFCL